MGEKFIICIIILYIKVIVYLYIYIMLFCEVLDLGGNCYKLS